MSIWEFAAVIAAQADDGNSLSESEKDDLWEWIKADGH